MKRKILSFLTLLVFTVIILSFNSCKKADNGAGEDTIIAQDNALADRIFSDTKTIADQAAISGSLKTYVPNITDNVLATCATISIDTISTTRKITIDFGSTGCMCLDNRLRQGKIMVTFKGHYRDSGAVISLSFDSFYVNGNHVLNSTTKSITNNGRNSKGNLSYTVNVNATIVKATGGTITWKSIRTNEWTKGEKTFVWGDDEYSITGSASGVSANGTSWTLDITKPLIVQLACKFITEGTLVLTPAKKSQITLDYGNGNCDDQATVTLNGKTYYILL